MWRTVRCVTGVAMAAMIAAGCATMRVSSHVDHGLVWAKYRTFDWGPADALPPGDPRLDKDPFFQDRVEGAIEKAMAARGFERAAAAQQPDLRIHYHASITDRLDVDALDRGNGPCVDAACRGRATYYEAGTLVVDIMDASTDVLLWRGWSQDSVEGVLGNRDRMRRRIDEGVARMFLSIPQAR